MDDEKLTNYEYALEIILGLPYSWYLWRCLLEKQLFLKGGNMAHKIVCDRCGKMFDPPKTESVMIMLNEDGNMRVKDLCDVCRESLDAWWTKHTRC